MNYRERLEDASREVDENNYLRLALYFILLLIVFWFVLVLSDENEKLGLQYKKLSVELADLLSIGDEAAWQERISEEQKNLESLSRLLWVGESENQKVALFQSALRKLVSESGITRSSVTVGKPIWLNEEMGLKQVRGRIRGGFHGNAALQLVTLIESHQPVFVIENIDIENNYRYPARGNRLMFDVVSFYEVSP